MLPKKIASAKNDLLSNDLDRYEIKDAPYIYNHYPRVPNFTHCCPTISHFQENGHFVHFPINYDLTKYIPTKTLLSETSHRCGLGLKITEKNT